MIVPDLHYCQGKRAGIDDVESSSKAGKFGRTTDDLAVNFQIFEATDENDLEAVTNGGQL